MEVRYPAVAGAFYSEIPGQLRHDLSGLLEQAAPKGPAAGSIKALIVPHAGYIYSGPVAATAYKLLLPRKDQIRRVVLLGPSHRVALRGMAIPRSGWFRTPLGDISLDKEALSSIADLPGVAYRDDAHDWEHSLEVQLPFLQTVLEEFRLIPIVVGLAEKSDVVRVLERLWGGEETLIVVSTDLSHYLPYELARQSDDDTTRMIEQLRGELVGEQACGCHPLNGMLQVAREKGLRIRTLDLRNSGDTAGERSRVVGYGSYVVYQ